MADWKDYKLKDVLGEKGYIRGPFGSSLKRDEMTKEGIPVYEQQHAIYDTRDFRFFIDSEKFKELKRFTVKENDLIISCSGTVGKVSIIKASDPKGIISQALLLLRPNSEMIFPEYLLYFFKTANGFYQLVNASHGSVQVNIASRDVVESIPISIPNKIIQKEILSVLSSFDNKIDLLHRQNKTLEAMAETLFRQWFIEEVGESWELGKVGDLFRLQRGFDLPANIRTEGQYPILSASGITGYHNKCKVKGAGVTTGRSGLLGKVFYVPDSFWPLNTSLFIVEYRLATPLFAYHFLKTLDLSQLNGGSAVPTLNRNDVHSINCELPPKQRISEFEEIAGTFFKKITSNINQIRTLTKLRDTLLPKLMSGEIRVGK